MARSARGEEDIAPDLDRVGFRLRGELRDVLDELFEPVDEPSFARRDGNRRPGFDQVVPAKPDASTGDFEKR